MEICGCEESIELKKRVETLEIVLRMLASGVPKEAISAELKVLIMATLPMNC